MPIDVGFVNTAELEEHRDDLGDGRPRALARRTWSRAGRVRATDRGRGRGARGPRGAAGAAARKQRDRVDRTPPRRRSTRGRPCRARRTVRAAARSASCRGRGSSGALGARARCGAEAMADGTWRELKACRSDTCRWAFVDHARNRSRQWCSMSVCGNREKARAFRARHALRAAGACASLVPAALALGVSFGVLARTAHFDADGGDRHVGDDVRRIGAGRDGLGARRGGGVAAAVVAALLLNARYAPIGHHASRSRSAATCCSGSRSRSSSSTSRGRSPAAGRALRPASVARRRHWRCGSPGSAAPPSARSLGRRRRPIRVRARRRVRSAVPRVARRAARRPARASPPPRWVRRSRPC